MSSPSSVNSYEMVHLSLCFNSLIFISELQLTFKQNICLPNWTLVRRKHLETFLLIWKFFFSPVGEHFFFLSCFCIFLFFLQCTIMTSCGTYSIFWAMVTCNNGSFLPSLPPSHRLFLNWRMKSFWWKENTGTFSCILQEQIGGVRISACGKPS